MIFICCLTLFMVSCDEKQKDEAGSVRSVSPTKLPEIEYGFLLDTFHVVRDKVKGGMTLSHVLAPHGVSRQHINLTDQKARSDAKMNFISEGHRYTLLKNKKDTTKTHVFIYEKNRIEYVIFRFEKEVTAQLVQRPVSVVEREMSGIIEKNSNLVFTIKEQLNDDAVAGELAETIAQVFAWTIDFFKLYPGDEFRVIYEEKQVEGVPYAIGKIKAAYFYNISAPYYAFRWEQNGEIGYWDENGKGMKRPFLKAPLKFSRITSGYSSNRLHPVQKVWKAHLGTDYAAPTGTPIMATADGMVEAAGYSGGNGNYVKLYHNKTYQTGYLHMSKIESGMKKGVRVKQGEIIGYVGSTGLATGPHVCYRFWKNGSQIDPRGEKFQSTEPIKESDIGRYKEYILPLRSRLDSIAAKASPQKDSLQ